MHRALHSSARAWHGGLGSGSVTQISTDHSGPCRLPAAISLLAHKTYRILSARPSPQNANRDTAIQRYSDTAILRYTPPSPHSNVYCQAPLTSLCPLLI